MFFFYFLLLIPLIICFLLSLSFPLRFSARQQPDRNDGPQRSRTVVPVHGRGPSESSGRGQQGKAQVSQLSDQGRRKHRIERCYRMQKRNCRLQCRKNGKENEVSSHAKMFQKEHGSGAVIETAVVRLFIRITVFSGG